MQSPMLDPIGQLDALAAQLTPSHRFTATSADDARTWQTRPGGHCAEALLVDQLESPPLAAE